MVLSDVSAIGFARDQGAKNLIEMVVRLGRGTQSGVGGQCRRF